MATVNVRITGQNASGPAFRGVETSLNRIRSSALNLARTLGVTFGAVAIAGFFRKAIEESAGAGVALAKVSTAISNAGESFESFQGQVDETVNQLQRLTRFSDDEGRDALSAMISITKDVEGSLRNLSVAANIATARQLSLRSAADLVGRAMTGETALLKRYGIVVKEGADAVEVMRATFAGFAENEGKTFQGRLSQLGNAFADLQEAIGDVITGQDTLGGALPGLTATINDLTEAVKRYDESIANAINGFFTLLRLGARVLTNALAAGLSTMELLVAKTTLLLGEEINRVLIRPFNDFAALLRVPLRVPELDTRPVEYRFERLAENLAQNADNVRNAFKDAVQELLRFNRLADSGGGGGGGGGGSDGGDGGGKKGKEFNNVAARGAGNTVAGGGRAVPKTTRPSILGGRLSPGGPNTSGKSPLREALEQEAADALEALREIQGQLAQGIADSLGDGIANGFAAALGKGGIGAGFKALTQTLLAGIGRAMSEFGKASLAASTLMLKIKAALASLNPVAAIAASVALIALGGLLSGAAASAFGGAGASGFSARGLTDTITRVTVTPTPASQSAAALTPLQTIVYSPTIIGAHDAAAQRQIVEMLNLAHSRGHKVSR